jgi:hypothetical protein
VLTAVAAVVTLSAGPALAQPGEVIPGLGHASAVRPGHARAAIHQARSDRRAVKPATSPTVSIPLQSSGSNSLCINPVGVTWADGPPPPSTLPTDYSNTNPIDKCDPPSTLSSLTTAINQGTQASNPCGYGGTVPVVTTPAPDWVGIDSAKQCSDLKNPPGPGWNPKLYIYDTEFNLPANACDVSISGHMLADNAVAAYLNTNLIAAQSDAAYGPTTNFTASPGTPFTHTGPSDFLINETNVLDFLVLDGSEPETGLDFSAVVTYTPCGTLKICKVAGFGVPVGQHVTFTTTPAALSGNSTFSVQAGPAPGGYCTVAGLYGQGSDVTVTESIPSGDSVSRIGVTPPGAQVGSVNLGTGTVEVSPGQGVTETTYTNVNHAAQKASGYLEICKQAVVSDPWFSQVNPSQNFQFTIGAQNINGIQTPSQTVNVPGGGCSAPIQVLAGAATVTENVTQPWNMTGCSLAGGGTLTACNLASRSATVTVPYGDVSSEAVLTITNSGWAIGPCFNCIVAFEGSVSLGDSNTAAGTVVGNATSGTPTGTMSFYECGPTASAQACTSTANQVGSPVTLVPGTGNTATATSVPFWPSSAGYWCLAEYYSGDSNYPASSDTSTDGCFNVPSTAVQLTTVTLPDAQTGVPYSAQLDATDGTTPYTWSATGLPSWLSLNATTGLLSGTPTGTGVFSLVVTVTDSSNPAQTATGALTLLAGSAPSITSASSTTFTVGTAGTFTVTTDGFPAPILTETGTLPAGVKFTDNHDGTATLAGTPKSGAGKSFAITITADNSEGPNATQDFTLNVNSSTTGTWTISPGGAISGKSASFTIKDAQTGTTLTCTSSDVTGSLKQGSGLSGTGIGSVTGLKASTCTGPAGLTFTMAFNGLPWTLNTASYGSGVTSGTIAGIDATLSGSSCSATLDGTAAGADNGTAGTTYTNATTALALLTSGSNLTLYNISGCAGLINNGDQVTVSATYKIAPKQKIISP